MGERDGVGGFWLMLVLCWVCFGWLVGDWIDTWWFLGKNMGVYFYGTALYSIRDRRAMNE